MPKRRDEQAYQVGRPFGNLTILAEGPPKVRVLRTWLCRCVCGGTKTVPENDLGRVQSCGCMKALRPKKHGHVPSAGNTHRGSPTYRSWQNMLSRCTNPNHDSYKHYGGRGITVYEPWREFVRFLADVGERPSEAHWLDRFPHNNGNYEPGNTRWSTIKEQCRNRRSNHRISVDDADLTIVEWAERLNVDRHTITRAILRGERPKDVIVRLSRRTHAEASK